MLHYTDQTGNTIRLNEIPKRIISIVPSQSELLWDFGLRDELVGITKFCIHPEELFKTKVRVGGTKKLNIDKIRALKPDLIIGNKEENERSQIEELQKEFNVWMSDIYTLADAFEMMKQLGEICGKEKEALRLVDSINISLNEIHNVFKKQKVAYFIWYKPYMVVAEHTFINYILNHLGFENSFGNKQRYPEVTNDDLKTTTPSVCFLSSEPFPFKDQHVEELKKLLPGSKILIVDGEVFSWYGSRLLHLNKYVKELLSLVNAE